MSVSDRNSNEKIRCFVCGREMPRYGDQPEWFGTLRGAEILEAVCVECYWKGERPPLMRDFDERKGSAK